jgi:phage tail sheath gpL-like
MSDAVTLDRISKIVGYKLTKGDFRVSSPNLPQRIAILAEANTANQTQALADEAGRELTTSQQAGELYGYGSPMHQIMRILRPINGGGLQIPIIAYPQEEADSATAKTITITPSGTATQSGTHQIVINGRNGVDGGSYDLNIVSGETAAQIAVKIEDIVNNVLGAPVTANEDTGVTTLTAKWSGLTSNLINVSINTGEVSLGITYAIANGTSGAGTPSVVPALSAFNENWNTIVINSYGFVSATLNELEAYNGKADNTNPTGRWQGEVFKPFIAISGTVLSDETALKALTSGRLNEMTIATAVAPNSKGLPLEAATNVAYLFAQKAQNTPHLDIQSDIYPDMPTPEIIGDLSDKDVRDRVVKAGCSTVELSGGKYKVVDFVTTYHPVGEVPPQFRYPRNINIDWNIRYGYLLKEATNVMDHVIAGDNDVVTASKVVKPKQWIQILQNYAEDLARRALITDVPFMQNSITVEVSSINPDRLETFFRYKRTGTARISSTTAEAGFNFGTNN